MGNSILQSVIWRNVKLAHQAIELRAANSSNARAIMTCDIALNKKHPQTVRGLRVLIYATYESR
jgi:hypothetical protein